MDPAESRDLIRSIGGALGERANRLWQDAANRGMAPVEVPSRSNRLIACTEDHCKGEVEGAMEPADAIDKSARMFGYGGGDPRMGQLQKECSTGAEEECGFSTHAPSQRGRTEETGRGISGSASQLVDLEFELVAADEDWLLG